MHSRIPQRGQEHKNTIAHPTVKHTRTRWRMESFLLSVVDRRCCHYCVLRSLFDSENSATMSSSDSKDETKRNDNDSEKIVDIKDAASGEEEPSHSEATDDGPPCSSSTNDSEDEGRPQTSTIQSRMMQNMLGGQATSLSECIMVVIAGQLLAFNSGFSNGACLSGFLLKSNRRQSVSAFTGAYTGSALLLADGHTTRFGFQACMILSFMFGACLSGIITPKAVQYRIEPTYGPTFFIGGIFLLTASILAAVDHDMEADDFVFYLTAIANGMQNGLSSLYSGNLIRSSHLTGTSTDIALFTGQLLRGNNTNNWKLIVLVALAASFWTGGFVSFYATQEFTTKTLLFNASLFLTVGIMLILFLMHEHSISFTQAVMGTWHWKRALNKLSSIHHNSETLSPSLREAGQRGRLLDLFKHVDADGSGAITPDELLDGLRQAGYHLSMRDIRIMIRVADRDGNGVISKEEWSALVDEILN